MSSSRKWALGITLWTALTVLGAMQTALVLSYNDQPFQWYRIFAMSFADWYTCGLFIPFYAWLTRVYPITRQQWPLRLPVYVLVTAAAVVGKYLVFLPLRNAMLGGKTPLAAILANNAIVEGMIVAAIIAALHGVRIYEQFREREALAARLQARLSEAQLQALRAQLNPHFLFNTINSVAALIHRDAHAADAMLTRLAELLQLTLRTNPQDEVTMAEELAVLDRYLDIMRVRFGSRLEIKVTVPDELYAARLPAFTLQPLVENALEHGVGQIVGAGSVRVTADRNEDMLVITVEDNGPGPAPSDHPKVGIGLATTRGRLAELYGQRQSLVLRPRKGGGCIARMEVPLQLTEQHA
jgi:two-component system, LytTR family, sensor kinase